MGKRTDDEFRKYAVRLSAWLRRQNAIGDEGALYAGEQLLALRKRCRR